MKLDRHERLLRMAQVVSAPLVLAIVEVFHPHPDDLLAVDVRTWLFVHFAQLALFPLAALAVTTLVRGGTGLTAALCRVAMFVFAVSFTAFDTAAGVVTGILVRAAHASGAPEAWRDAIDVLWRYPIMGGSLRWDQFPSLSVLGSMALPVGTVAAAAWLKRAGHSWAPVLLLALSGFGLVLFNTHAWPGGPLTFGALAVAAGWLQWQGAQATVPARVPSRTVAAAHEVSREP